MTSRARPVLSAALVSAWADEVRAEASPAATDDLAAHLLFSFAVLLAAGFAHWVLRRIELHLPAVLARRAAGADLHRGGALRERWQRRLTLLLLPLKISLWCAALYWFTEQFKILRAVRAQLALVLQLSLSAPLFKLSKMEYSAIDLLLLPLVLAVLWLLVSAATRIVRSQILRPAGLERGAEDTIAILIRYPLLFIGATVMFQVWGIDVSSLAVLAGVLGVGVGFGLQNLANNFVSGLVLNLERPIRPGDFINLGELTGTVDRIGARCTLIRTLDHLTILVPNSRLLENEVINWSHGDPMSRLHLPVGVAYGSPSRRVRRVLLDAALENPNVLRDPRPQVQFKGFGESALDFELLVWTADPRGQQELKSDLNFRIEDSLARHGIQIPFPQRDLHLRSPQIDKLLAAWGKRTFPEEDLAPPAAGAAVGNDTLDGTIRQRDDESRVRAPSESELPELMRRMRAAEGLDIRDRRHLLTVYPKCFVGSEAVEWMTRALGLTRSEAIRLGQLLVEQGFAHHVLDEHGFEDAHLFYRFYADET